MGSYVAARQSRVMVPFDVIEGRELDAPSGLQADQVGRLSWSQKEHVLLSFFSRSPVQTRGRQKCWRFQVSHSQAKEVIPHPALAESRGGVLALQISTPKQKKEH